ncbi:MAG: class IV adenylate cyclase, partial [Candidatus Acidiferrales bacterium]
MHVGEKETEIKLEAPDLPAVRRRLREQGFRVRQRRRFEDNVLFDTAEKMLRRSGLLLRLRSAGGRHWLTFKGPAQESRRYKIRQEFESELSHPVAVRTVLASLGLAPGFRYQKFRTVYRARGARQGGEVMLDETPIGTFLELEGRPAWILRVARGLGRRPSQFITRSYAELYA